MKNFPTKQLLTLWVLMTLTGCATQPAVVQTVEAPVETLEMTEQKVIGLLQQVSKTSARKQMLNKISHCRYELSTLWSSPEKGFYGAINKQRFSFTHDIRDISHVPEYFVKFDDNVQHWQEMIQLSFNRQVPATFSNVSTDDYQPRVRHSTNDRYSISGFNTAPAQVMEQLLTGLLKMTSLCGNDISKISQISHKIIGRWDIYGLSKSRGTLVVDGQKATVMIDASKSIDTPYKISGPYKIENKGSHYILSIRPQAPSSQNSPDLKEGSLEQYDLILDFVTSNYARLLLPNDNPTAEQTAKLNTKNVPFVKFDPKDKHSANPDELKLFRMGDLR